MEGVTAVLLLTAEHDFNALASTSLEGNLDGVVYRAAAPADRHGVIAPYTGSPALFGGALTGSAVGRRHQAGAEIVTRPAKDGVPDGHDVLFIVRADGRLVPVTDHDRAGRRTATRSYCSARLRATGIGRRTRSPTGPVRSRRGGIHTGGGGPSHPLGTSDVVSRADEVRGASGAACAPVRSASWSAASRSVKSNR